MKLSNFQIEILKQLKKRRQGASVYRLDRVLSYGEFLSVIDTLLPVLRALMKQDLVRGDTQENLFFITETGEKFLQKESFVVEREAA